MPRLGQHHTQETKDRISASVKRACREGRLFNEQHRRNISLSHKGKLPSALEKSKFKKGSPSPRKGVKLSGEIRKKLSFAHKGKKNPKLSRYLKKYPRIPWNKGKHGIYSKETIDKIRKARLRQKIPFEYTDIERAIEQLLEELQIPYVHSFNLGDKFLCDFAIPSARLIIECDGDYWHSLPQMKRRDRAKDAYAKKCGWIVLRLSENHILNDITSCKHIIINIARRFSDYMSENGAVLDTALNSGDVKLA